MVEPIHSQRFRVETFYAQSLRNNPIHSPENRVIHIYLPPNYLTSEERYPVVYSLHGYSGNQYTLIADHREKALFSWMAKEAPTLYQQINFSQFFSYARLDQLITKKQLKPFIFVQPDASLYLPHKDGVKTLNGRVSTKGSFYLNSPFTGNFENYIADDVITYVDTHYRTIPEKPFRALMGVSMGGYGALNLGIQRPERFTAVAALSPANITLDLISWNLVIPLYAKILGRQMAERMGATAWNDILDTLDLIYSKDTPLLSSLQRDDAGQVISWDQQALENWRTYDISTRIHTTPKAFDDVKLLLNCERTDEFGLALETEKIHQTLAQHHIMHEYELYADPKARFSPHILGIAYNIIPSVQFCVRHIS